MSEEKTFDAGKNAIEEIIASAEVLAVEDEVDLKILGHYDGSQRDEVVALMFALVKAVEPLGLSRSIELLQAAARPESEVWTLMGPEAETVRALVSTEVEFNPNSVDGPDPKVARLAQTLAGAARAVGLDE